MSEPTTRKAPKPTPIYMRPAVASALERRRRRVAFNGIVPKAMRCGYGYWVRNAERLST